LIFQGRGDGHYFEAEKSSTRRDAGFRYFLVTEPFAKYYYVGKITDDYMFASYIKGRNIYKILEGKCFKGHGILLEENIYMQIQINQPTRCINLSDLLLVF
jgi:hypothetical protein